jgi:DNA-3-methyladenine glycosylase II
MAEGRSHGRTARHKLSVVEPFRLDLTATALRRLPTNVVDLLTPAGEYLRALEGEHGAVVVRVTQTKPEALNVTIEGAAAEHARALALVRRMLGVDRDVSAFDRAAARVPWLKPLVHRLRGVKPPRYPSLWEAFVNVVVFQQVSLKAASTIVKRVVVSLGTEVERQGVSMYVFPSAERVLDAKDALLRGAGLSPSKLATLRRAGGALLSGELDEAMLEERTSAEAAELLRRIKGIGPWSATVILLRGLGRLDVFPGKDTSVMHNLALVTGSAPRDVKGTLERLGAERGMLYYYLLLARLEASGTLGAPEQPPSDDD